MNVGDKLQTLYEEWLLDEYNDEIGCKDRFVEMLGSGEHHEEFVDLVSKKLEDW